MMRGREVVCERGRGGRGHNRGSGKQCGDDGDGGEEEGGHTGRAVSKKLQKWVQGKSGDNTPHSGSLSPAAGTIPRTAGHCPGQPGQYPAQRVIVPGVCFWIILFFSNWRVSKIARTVFKPRPARFAVAELHISSTNSRWRSCK